MERGRQRQMGGTFISISARDIPPSWASPTCERHKSIRHCSLSLPEFLGKKVKEIIMFGCNPKKRFSVVSSLNSTQISIEKAPVYDRRPPTPRPNPSRGRPPSILQAFRQRMKKLSCEGILVLFTVVRSIETLPRQEHLRSTLHWEGEKKVKWSQFSSRDNCRERGWSKLFLVAFNSLKSDRWEKAVL